MKIDKICPNCGGALVTEDCGKKKVCPFCDSEFIVENLDDLMQSRWRLIQVLNSIAKMK